MGDVTKTLLLSLFLCLLACNLWAGFSRVFSRRKYTSVDAAGKNDESLRTLQPHSTRPNLAEPGSNPASKGLFLQNAKLEGGRDGGSPTDDGFVIEEDQ